MKSIGISEAKTVLWKLLDRVVRGEKIIITRRGVPAALLIPVTETAPKLTHQGILEGMRGLRKRVKPSKMSFREMVNEGRRF
jgi:prevent-host-death family protein